MPASNPASPKSDAGYLLVPGALHVDIVAGEIVCIEVLWGITGSIRGLLGKLLSDAGLLAVETDLPTEW